MIIKKAYYYLFYKLYRFYESSPSVWWSEWKALLTILILEIWFLMSFGIYYQVITKKDLLPDNIFKYLGIALIIFLGIINYYVFDYNDRWKRYVSEFNKWPRNKNRIGTFIVWLFILIIIGNLIYSYYLMSKIDWKKY